MAFSFFVMFTCAFVVLLITLHGIEDSLDRIADALERDIEGDEDEEERKNAETKNSN